MAFKFSGLASSAIFIGLLAVLVYFCCRAKKKGAVLQRSANNFHNVGGGGVTVSVQQQPQTMTGGLIGYPHPMAPQSHHGYAPQNSVYGQTTTGNPYNPYSPSYPSANANTTNLPYPAATNPVGMPMPSNGLTNNAMQRSAAPYRTGNGALPSAPIFDHEDLPPPYETVVRQS